MELQVDEMNRWKNIDRTDAGRPVLVENEAILFVQNSVGLYDGFDRVCLSVLTIANSSLLITKMERYI